MSRTLRSEKGSDLTYLEMDNNFRFQAAITGSGLYKGGNLVDAIGNTTFTIETGDGLVIDNTDPMNPEYHPVTWPEITGVTIGSQAATFVAIDKDLNVVKSDVPFTPAEFKLLVSLGSVNHVGATIDSVSEFTTMRPYDIAPQVTELMDALGVINLEGNMFSGKTGTANIEVTGGNTFFLGIDRASNEKTVSVLDAPTFAATWRDGVGGWYVEFDDEIHFGRYDDNSIGPYTDGPNGTVGPSQWTILRFQRSPDSGLVVVTYGRNTYSTLDDAMAAVRDEEFEPNPEAALLPFRAAGFVRGNGSDAGVDTDMFWRSATNVGGEF